MKHIANIRMLFVGFLIFVSQGYVDTNLNMCAEFDSKLWKSDRYGCRKTREKLFKNSLKYCNLKGFNKYDMEALLGKPDFYHMSLFKINIQDTLYRAIYYMEPCQAKCRCFIFRGKIKTINEYVYEVIYRKDIVISHGASIS